jgi:hypothetical protein
MKKGRAVLLEQQGKQKNLAKKNRTARKKQNGMTKRIADCKRGSEVGRDVRKLDGESADSGRH